MSQNLRYLFRRDYHLFKRLLRPIANGLCFFQHFVHVVALMLESSTICSVFLFIWFNVFGFAKRTLVDLVFQCVSCAFMCSVFFDEV